MRDVASAHSFVSTFRCRSIAKDHEDGFVLVFAALTLTVLLGIAGFSVDFGNWYLHIERARAAADSAALAGAVYLPDQPDVALAEAKKSLVSNHVPTELIDQADIHPLAPGSGTLVVTVPTEAQNAFIPLIGLPNVSHFNVTSSAQWQPGLGIGDYSNALGSEPPDATRPNSDQWQSEDRRANQSQFWLATGGAENDKQDGDRFGAKHCDGSSSGCAGGVNAEFKADPDGMHTAGYEYVISAEKGAQGNVINIQVYDPAVANTDEDCGDLQDIYAASGNNVRYAPEQNVFCTGDKGDATTYYAVFDSKTKMPVAACGPEKAFAPLPDPSAAALQDPTFVAQFHEWVTICSAPYDALTGNEYILRVRSDVNKGGENIYSLRAGLFNGSPGPTASGTLLLEPSQANVRVYAKKDLPVWANFSGANTQFAIASIPPSYAGQDVALELFDLGDASDAGTLTVIASGRTASGASPTTSCDYVPPHQKATQPLENCTLPNVSQDTGFQGQAFSIVWHVPSDYACDITGADPTANCFVFLKLAYPEGTEVHDRTTWSASGDTKPLRLVPTPKTTIPQ